MIQPSLNAIMTFISCLKKGRGPVYVKYLNWFVHLNILKKSPSIRRPLDVLPVYATPIRLRIRKREMKVSLSAHLSAHTTHPAIYALYLSADLVIGQHSRNSYSFMVRNYQRADVRRLCAREVVAARHLRPHAMLCSRYVSLG